MSITLKFVDRIDDPQGLRDLFLAYATDILPLLAAVGGPVVDPEIIASVIDTPAELLPPRHRLLLATDADAQLVGCGSLRRIREDAAEMKRMYVRPEARGTGLGRRLFEGRIAEARRMGLKWLFADTVKGNRPMLGMYEKLGFSYIDRYPENANPEEFARYLVYLSLRL